VEPDSARLWDYYHAHESEWQKQQLLPPDQTLEESNVVDNQMLLLEVGATPPVCRFGHRHYMCKLSVPYAAVARRLPVAALASAS
jgi:hypothetical protein